MGNKGGYSIIKNIHLAWFFGLILVFSHVGVEAENIDEPQVRHQQPTVIERGALTTLSFSTPGIRPNDVQEAYLFYRGSNEIAYRQKKATLEGSNFVIPVSIADKQAQGLEYYFKIQLQNGKTVTYPRQAAESPVSVRLVETHKTDRERRVQETGIDYTILSPEPGATISKSDVVVALTLFYNSSEIDTANTSFQMLVDGEDVTGQANASDYFYTYSPDGLSAGDHTAEFNLLKTDTTLTIAQWSFSVLDPETAVHQAGQQNESWKPKGNIEVAARTQDVGGISNDALSGNVQLSGQRGDISYSLYGRLTSQEDLRLQPQNRYSANIYVGDWLEFEAGHVYPTLNSLTIAGQRMQGLNVGLHAWHDAVNLRVIYGKLRRGIDNIYQNVSEEPEVFGQDTLANSYVLRTQGGGSGTYKRNIAGTRLGFERGDSFEFGLNFLKVQDDTNSINEIDGFNSLMNQNPQLIQNLSSSKQQQLSQNPDLLSVEGNPRPKGNFVAASDLEMRFDDSRIMLQADAGISLLNNDISRGPLDKETAGQLGFSLDNSTKNLLDRLSWLIIINQNMNTLPFNFENNGTETTSDIVFPTSNVAFQSKLGLKYFDNNLSVRYRWVGPGYNSLANRTIRGDIAGVTISDQIQLMGNRIYLTVGYEHLQDNVSNTKRATTTTNTQRLNVSWYPISQDLPQVSVGFLHRGRDNNVSLLNPFVPNNLQKKALQNFDITGTDTVIAPTPQSADTYQLNTSISQEFSLWGITHNSSLSYSYTKTNDQVSAFGGTLSNSLSMQIINRFQNKPYQTSLSINWNSTESGSGLSNIDIWGFQLGGSMFFWDNTLSLDASLAFTKNTMETNSLDPADNGTPQESRDDYYVLDTASMSESNAYIINIGGQYNITDRQSVRLNGRYSNVANPLSRAGIPNDYLLQARYIFNF
ncbi:hypothetical protein LX73_1087 [Fodinibius salinus]|uniref:Uncharacterized protein n=1 Tax=Fodinibius salinus TaxID=860790 RepID=A0A5D3YHK8_9BACT|nr:hypothetical protein [Fodinibius salinus]TYP93384.1 hypothetical protein LX73_1087 [Fodinibius salinus]